jgi:hypothetical protein
MISGQQATPTSTLLFTSYLYGCVGISNKYNTTAIQLYNFRIISKQGFFSFPKAAKSEEPSFLW